VSAPIDRRTVRPPARCRARARTRGGQSCQRSLVRGKKRCRMHGGLSTDGLERSRRARWVHGRHSREAIEARRRANWETLEQGVARIQNLAASRTHLFTAELWQNHAPINRSVR
jgi:hypothetical protein